MSVRLDRRAAQRVARLAGAAKQNVLLVGELRDVRRARKQFHLNSRMGTQVYYLRRRIHMLEKGLSMRPRRDTFAASYIGEVIEMFQSAQANGDVSGAESAWARDVLNSYFEATAQSTNPSILHARATWSSLPASGGTPPGQAVPQPVGDVLSDIPMSELLRLGRGRKSVRWFLSDPVPVGVVDDASALAQSAPTACNRQPYRFIIVDEPELARAVGGCAGGTAGYLHNIQNIAVVVGDLSAFAHYRDRHVIYVDASMAAMNFILGLQAQGVGSCCINWPDVPDRDRAIRKILNLESHERVVMLIAYGYADPTGLAPHSQRKSLQSTVSRAGR
jgi:nitroreductase